jgi:hypothetical protein
LRGGYLRGYTSPRGRLAQLVERLLYTQNVGGSNPSPPTSLRKRSAAKAGQSLAAAWRAATPDFKKKSPAAVAILQLQRRTGE